MWPFSMAVLKKTPARFGTRYVAYQIFRHSYNQSNIRSFFSHTHRRTKCAFPRTQGELGFFDFYVLPLAKQLRDCGVFGSSSNEYLMYGTKNREEWELRGKQVVESMVERARAKYAAGGGDGTTAPMASSYTPSDSF